MRRRALLGCVWLCLAWPLTAYASSYLNRAALVLEAAKQEWDWLRQHPRDRELARLVQRSAEARLLAMRESLVPSDVAMAHPHLLLMLEHYERAAHAAVQREFKTFYQLGTKARDEEQLFVSVLERLGHQLPKHRANGRSGR